MKIKHILLFVLTALIMSPGFNLCSSTTAQKQVPHAIYSMNVEQIEKTMTLLVNLHNSLTKMHSKTNAPHSNVSRIYTKDQLNAIAIAIAQRKLILDNPEKDSKWPTFSQDMLLQKAKKQSDISHAVIGISTFSGWAWQQEIALFDIQSQHTTLINAPASIIGITEERNLDRRLCSLYHELGHAAHNNYFYRIHAATILKNPTFMADIQKINDFRLLAQKTIDRSSNIGNAIRNKILYARLAYTLLQQYNHIWAFNSIYLILPIEHLLKYTNPSMHTMHSIAHIFECVRPPALLCIWAWGAWASTNPFWIEPSNQEDTENYRFLHRRGAEQRADLFALEKLFEQGLINPILSWVKELLTCNSQSEELCAFYEGDVVREGTQTEHPSNLERALYALGFLVAHGVDVNATLRNYEAHGTCIDAEDLNAVLSYIHQKKCSKSK